MGATSGGRTASELAPVHDHADVCGTALICERRGVGEGVEKRGDEDGEDEVVECLEGYYLERIIIIR